MTNENDPLDWLGQAFGDVPAPDQWNDIVARGEETPRPIPASASFGHARWRFAAAAVAFAALVGGVAAIVNRGSSEPTAPSATAVGDTLPPPDSVLPCTTEADLDAVVDVVTAGLGQLDLPPVEARHLTLGDTVIAAEVSGMTRVEGRGSLVLRGTPTYLVGQGPVDAVSALGPWDPSNGPDPLERPLRFDDLRIVASLRSLSSAPVWAPDVGGLVIGCADTDVRAINTANNAPLVGEPSIDEVIESLTGAVNVPQTTSAPSVPQTTAPLTTPPSRPAPMACVGDTDLNDIVTLLRTGLGDVDYERAATLEELAGRSEVVVRANVTEAWRDPDDDPNEEDLGTNVFTGMRVADVEVLAGAQVAVEAFGFGSFWAGGQGPDPLAVPVTITDTVVVAFLRSFDQAPGGWSVDPEGLFVSCPNGINPRAVLGNVDFLDYSSPLHHFADQIRFLGAEAAPSPWASSCVERLGTGAVAPEPDDWSAFGPLGAEPGLQLQLPAQNVPAGYAPGTTIVGRLPGGLHVTSRAPDGSESIVVAVDHNGTVRWRRCIAGYVEVHASTGASVGLLDIWITADIGGTHVWELIDLGTGASSPAPSELDGRSLAAPVGGFAVFPSTDDTIGDSSRLAVLDLETMVVELVPYPDTWFGSPPTHFSATPYEIDGEVVLIRWWDTGGLSVVYVDGTWSEYAAAVGPTADALRAFLRERVSVSFWNVVTDQNHLTAYSGDNEVVWERPDLLPIGGEGLHVSPQIGTGEDPIFVVNACRQPSGIPADCGSLLAGISGRDGRTLWQIEGARQVPILADGYAVVVVDGGYHMIDVRTGEQAPGTPTWDRTAFTAECCGGGDYFYVGQEGAVAWTVSADHSGAGDSGPHVKVWYPSGATDATTTVDLLGN